jgi:hypothetical protein
LQLQTAPEQRHGGGFFSVHLSAGRRVSSSRRRPDSTAQPPRHKNNLLPSPQQHAANRRPALPAAITATMTGGAPKRSPRRLCCIPAAGLDTASARPCVRAYGAAIHTAAAPRITHITLAAEGTRPQQAGGKRARRRSEALACQWAGS